MWEPAYLASCVLFGQSPNDALATLDDAGRARASSLATALATSDRGARARALAVEVAKIARAADEGVLR